MNHIENERKKEMMRRFEKSYGKFTPDSEHSVHCPTCRAEPYEPCFDMRTVDMQTQYVAKTHSTRIQFSRESVICNTLKQYQLGAIRTANYTDNKFFDISVLAMGLAGESGEVVDIIKKVVGHGHDLNTSQVKDELGDVLWYIAVLAHRMGIGMQELATQNIMKLRKRYPNGFTEQDSINRSA